jgi:hypothetical protein
VWRTATAAHALDLLTGTCLHVDCGWVGITETGGGGGDYGIHDSTRDSETLS